MRNHFASLRKLYSALLSFICIAAITGACKRQPDEPTRVLVFSKTTVFRHESIGAGIEAIRKLGQQHHFVVDTTENSAAFHEENLKRYKAVIFLSTTGDVLNGEQQNNFERYIQAGGGYLGIHAASDTEYDWPWYGKLVGAYFTSHPNAPNVRTADFHVVDKNNPATDSLPDPWKRDDEFYNFKDINPDIKVLLTIDEKSYEGGTNGDHHPMAWYHHYDGGRAFYTALGHTNETFSDPLFLRHLWGGLQFVLGGDEPLNYKAAHTLRMPEENRFTKVVLDEKLNEPVELAILPGDDILFVERHGAVKIYSQQEKKTKVIATIAVSTKYKDKEGKESEAEDGLLGVVLDPAFATNHWVYFYYSDPGAEPRNILVRYELRGDKLIEESKKVMLEVAVQREQCCHTGGSMAFDAHGNLYLSTGDNTSPRATAYAPIDERAERSPWDAQKSSANTNDLRGKILRIHPEADGTYTIPDGNLFPKGTAQTRPEIYVMGNRNPYRIDFDKKTGYLYWGDVGPDAGKDSTTLGPRAYDEIGQARGPGFYGWPYFVGDNKAYFDYDFASNKTGAKFDPAKPRNESPNNTGLKELPPAQKAFIWYPYDASPEFPLVGTGGRTAMAGPVYYTEDFVNAPRAFPEYYNGKLFIYEWMRGWIMAVTMDKEGNYVSMERFMPSHRFSNPMDMAFSPSGDLYILEYGTAWFQGNDDARLVRIEYNGGNRKPQIRMAADHTRGAVPFTVNLNAEGTKDYDHDELKYAWRVTAANGQEVATHAEATSSVTLDKPGVYTAALTVTDAKGDTSTAKITLEAGNDPPQLSFDITKGNTSFFFPGKPFDYEVKVTDKEDGSTEAGTITADHVSLSIDYLEGFDKIAVAQGHQAADASASMAVGKRLMDNSDCKSCHIIDKKSIGPRYLDVAAKYKNDPKALEYLTGKIIAGGGGVWGETAMAAHPQLKKEDVQQMVKYILSLGNAPAASLPIKGSYTPTPPKGSQGQGTVILRAAYTDHGANGIAPITSEKTMTLRSASVMAGAADQWDKVQKYKMPDPPIELMIGTSKGAHLIFKQVDLTGISAISFVAMAPENMLGAAGGTVEVRLDYPGGEVVGESPMITPVVMDLGGKTPPKPQIVTAPLKPTSGKHDLYFVYKNEKADPTQALFILINIIYH
ncbi:ThuA domain-containing protein [Dawidia soli]|uniref:ThuA domain-containing protein n=1 Tax=Dawidia soli TaxID=2782352 RepID=A0AAP2DCF9_9BACT|nr:ThuA domain-containing protein [Dawidia soli]MBT1688255.1 ThuA domain-containing protein [Dawidia soli]